jgi:hypothetical protein
VADDIQIWQYLLSGSVGVGLAGALVRLGVQKFQRRRRTIGNWSALFIEVEESAHNAQTFLQDGVRAPLYRLPTTSFEICYPALLSDAAIDEGEANALLRFFSQAQTINRGLDLADQLARANSSNQTPTQFERDVYNRNISKAERIAYPNSDLYDAAARKCRSRKF